MKRNISLARAPSPTNTAYSGISNYRTDSYKPLRDRTKQDIIAQSDSRSVARAHYEEMSSFLANHLAKEPANARSSAREKLTRLTKQQFQELSTDVYDELMRRKNNTENEEVPFLPVRDDFHPKRNQARQKLATLPKTRFKDLSSDVFYELGRRYPEFHEVETPLDVTSPGSTYDEMDLPSPDFPFSPINSKPSTVRTTPDYAGTGKGSARRPSEDIARRRPYDEVNHNDEDMYGGNSRKVSEDGFMRDVQLSSVASSRRKPSQDVVQGLKNDERRRVSPDIASSGRKSSDDQDRDRMLGRKPSATASTTSESNTSSANAQREIIIPNKSTITEEAIEVPFGRERESSSSTAIDDRHSGSPDDSPAPRRADFDLKDLTKQTENVRSPQSPPFGLGGLGNRLREQIIEDDDEDEEDLSGVRSGEEYFDQMSFGRVSVASDRSTGTGGPKFNARSSRTGGENVEGLRREYEFKLATMQNRITGLERNLEGAVERERRLREVAGEDKVAALEIELKTLTEKMEVQTTAMLSLQQEIDSLLQAQAADKEREKRRAEEDAKIINNLNEQIKSLENERTESSGMFDSSAVDQLRSDLEGLITGLDELSYRNEELLSLREKDAAVIQTLEAQLAEYKRKYETVKTDLRSYKASQVIPPPTESDFDFFLRSDGGLLDIHISSFLMAVNDLLTISRSDNPSRTLSSVKIVVDSVYSLLADIKEVEQRHSLENTEFDLRAFHAITDNIDATLSNLVSASRTYVISSGLSPVSLLDAAVSHLSFSITNMGSLIGVRTTSLDERERMSERQNTPFQSTNADVLQQTERNGVDVKIHSSLDRAGLGPDQIYPESENEKNLPPQTELEKNRSSGNDSLAVEGPDEAWSELKPYLEAQSESIVYAIQSVLSNVRSPNPAPSLNEHLTQIITIVSSIVAVCKDNIPPATATQGQDILRELSDHANKLSELQNQNGLTKESRQVMAKSSFAIANAMKSLMKL